MIKNLRYALECENCKGDGAVNPVLDNKNKCLQICDLCHYTFEMKERKTLPIEHWNIRFG